MCNHKLRILYISHSAHLYGAEQSLLLLLKGLDRDRFSPIVVLPQEGPLKQRISDLSIPVEVVPSIRAWLTRRKGVMRLLHHIGLIPFLVWSVWVLMRLVRRYHIQLVHTNSLVIIDGALAARLSGVPHVWHAREMLVRESPYNSLFGPRNAMRLVDHLADRIIATSDAARLCFGQVSDSKIVVVFNAVDIPAFDAIGSRSELRREFNISQRVPVVGEVANVVPIKGCEDYVQAAAQVHRAIPEAVFLLVGGTPYPKYTQKIIDLIVHYQLEDHFILTGYRHDLLDVYSTIDLLVLPSHYETFGRVLVEAMAAGKPVIGTTVGGIPEIIEDGITGILIPPNSPNELAKAIKVVLRDPEMSQQMGQASRQRVQTLFGLERYIKEVEKVYEDLR